MSGYRGEILRLLEAASADVGDVVKVESAGRSYEGVIMPRTELGDPEHLVLKLKSGYNVGVRLDKAAKISLLESRELPKLSVQKLSLKPDANKPNVTIIGTGGTIASRIDYRTGAVYPAFTAEDIYSTVPEVADIANVKVVEACNVFSEHMNPDLWAKIGRAVAEEINGGADGVVVAHGTDTMGYTASALSFMLKGLFRPVVMVGSQRSSDRPSSDAALNLISAVAVAGKSDIAEVSAVMHGSIDDDFCIINRGTKVRKCHTSRRDAFQSVNDIPLGMVRGAEVKMFRHDYGRASPGGKVKVEEGFEKKVALLKVTPGMSSSIIEALVADGYKGIVLEGTGLGHAPESLYAGISFAVKKGLPVVMTSQCIWGRVDMNVYSTGRDLLKLGVIPGEDMLPEVAWVKLMWLLSRASDTDELRGLMSANLAGEMTPRTDVRTFMTRAEEWASKHFP